MIPILGVDPGGTTGFCFLQLEGNVLHAQIGGQLTPGPFVRRVVQGTTGRTELVIACESYMIGANTLKMTRQHDPLELIGWLRHTSILNGWEFETQSPSSSKRLVTDDMLKMTGLYAKGREHGNDAMRQALLWLARREQRIFTNLQETCYDVDAALIT